MAVSSPRWCNRNGCPVEPLQPIDEGTSVHRFPQPQPPTSSFSYIKPHINTRPPWKKQEHSDPLKQRRQMRLTLQLILIQLPRLPALDKLPLPVPARADAHPHVVQRKKLLRTHVLADLHRAAPHLDAHDVRRERGWAPVGVHGRERAVLRVVRDVDAVHAVVVVFVPE